MALNQYTDLVPSEWFSEYKKPETTDKRKAELVDTAFKNIRAINTYPEPMVSYKQEVQALKTLATFDPWGIYNDNEIAISTVGITLCGKYYPNILDVKKAGTSISMRESFFNDRILRRCLEKIFLYGTSISDLNGWIRISGCGYCNNFRPAAAKVVYDTNLKPNSKVYDYAAGYGGRLFGAWAASNVDEYVAVDPNTETHNNAIRFSKFLNDNYPNLKRTEILKIGSEEFTVESYPHYKSYFDIAFSSPQYFNTEIYSDEPTQSCIKFNSYERWVKGFLKPTIDNCIDVLKPDGIFAINIFANLPNIKKIIQHLCDSRGFALYKIDKLLLQVMPGLVKKEGEMVRREKTGGKPEPIWYFKHRDYL